MTFTINPFELIRRRKENIKTRKYKKFNFDITLLEKLEIERVELIKEIEKLYIST